MSLFLAPLAFCSAVIWSVGLWGPNFCQELNKGVGSGLLYSLDIYMLLYFWLNMHFIAWAGLGPLVIIRRQCIVNWALCNILWALHVSFLSVYVVIKMFYFCQYFTSRLNYYVHAFINVINLFLGELGVLSSSVEVCAFTCLVSFRRLSFDTFILKASSTLSK